VSHNHNSFVNGCYFIFHAGKQRDEPDEYNIRTLRSPLSNLDGVKLLCAIVFRHFVCCQRQVTVTFSYWRWCYSCFIPKRKLVGVSHFLSSSSRVLRNIRQALAAVAVYRVTDILEVYIFQRRSTITDCAADIIMHCTPVDGEETLGFNGVCLRTTATVRTQQISRGKKRNAGSRSCCQSWETHPALVLAERQYFRERAKKGPPLTIVRYNNGIFTSKDSIILFVKFEITLQYLKWSNDQSWPIL
jgi:hypothetical protein